MINASFNIRNPFSSRWACIANPTYRIGNLKAVELQLDKTSDILGFHFRLTTRQSHSGVFAGISLLGYEATFHFYDVRHWDNDNNCWSKL